MDDDIALHNTLINAKLLNFHGKDKEDKEEEPPAPVPLSKARLSPYTPMLPEQKQVIISLKLSST